MIRPFAFALVLSGAAAMCNAVETPTSRHI